jgi:hypothetical protein
LSKIVSYVGLFLVFLSTVSSSIFSAKVDRLKDQRIDTLVKGNAELLKRIDVYQTDLLKKQATIEELQIAAKKAERGISSTWDFRGVKRDIRPGVIKAGAGDELAVFKKMQEYQVGRQWEALIKLCTEQIQKTPEWYTPYLFRGIGYANIGQTEKAIQDVELVTSSTPGDPEYAQATDILRQIKENAGPSK